jgi:ABC-2 type transport system permease protein
MNFALTSFRKDIARWRQDFMSTLIWIAIPLLVGGMITALMSGEGIKPHGTLLVTDQDESLFSEFIAAAYTAGELGELISVEKVSLEDGTERINAGEASGFLIIPEGFGDAFLNAEPVTLTLKTNPSQTILPGIITEVTEILLDAGFYLHQLFSSEIGTIKSFGDNPPNELVAAMAVTLQNKFESIAPQLYPPVIELSISEPPTAEPSTPLAVLFLPGIIVMAVVFSANGLANDYWREREQGTLRRLVFVPGKLGGFVVGKALAATVTISLIGGLTLALGFIYHGISWMRLPSSLAWIAISGVALFAWLSMLQMSFSSRRSANVISSMLLFPLLMAGGSFFPLAVLPGWIAVVGRASPNGFVVDRLTNEITAIGTWNIEPASWLVVITAAVVGLFACALRLRSGFART